MAKTSPTPAPNSHGEVLVELGRRVRELRKQRGWPRRELAQRAQISERFLADVESGRANPSLLKLCELASALSTTPIGLLGAPDSGPNRRRVVGLLGLRGAGKSTIGRATAARLGCHFIELDAEIERSTGLELGQLFELNGEQYFRRAERAALMRILAETQGPVILATGGGIVTDPETYDLLRQHAHTVWLEARPEDHWNRVVAQGDTRPMEGHDEAFAALRRIFDERRSLYARADLTVATSNRDVDAVSQDLLNVIQPLLARPNSQAPSTAE